MISPMIGGQLTPEGEKKLIRLVLLGIILTPILIYTIIKIIV